MKNDFKSILAIEFRDYLRLLLSAGRSTHNHEVMLRNLDSFLLQSNISVSYTHLTLPTTSRV